MAAIPVHPSAGLRLSGKAAVDQRTPCRGTRARGQHSARRAITRATTSRSSSSTSSCCSAASPRHHGELVRPGRGPIVEIRSAAALEGTILAALGGSRVGWRQVGVVVGTAQGHRGGDGRRVGEGGRVVHPGTRETALRQRGESWELALKLAWEGT